MSDIALLSCPACGCDGPVYSHGKYGYCLQCLNCNMCAPVHKMQDLAADAWNALPRALTWTKEPPKAGGYYYAESYDRTQTLFTSVVEVFRLNKELFAIFPGNEVERPLDDFLRWAGPISMPKELTE